MMAKISNSSVETPAVVSTSFSASNSPKLSMFGSKSGFVIPKNKLSGSLVPIFRGGGKIEAGDANKEEAFKQVQRKTKWGTDLTQDTVVRKGRTLAYQIRLEQIAKQLTSTVSDIGDDQDSQLGKTSDDTTFQSHNALNVSETLELEKREIIGEILRLNPNYKPPSNYRPLLKEDKVPIPIKLFSGYNFIGLLLGPEGKTQKRLEEETGAKIRVYGTRKETREKRELTQSDINEAQAGFEELYVNVSADTFEKVDAAIALIELLLTPVAGNIATSSKSASGASNNATNVDISEATNSLAGVQPMTMLVQAGPQQFPSYSVPWRPVITPNFLPPQVSGFLPSSMANSTMQFRPTLQAHTNEPAFVGQAPFGPIPRAWPAVVSRPQSSIQAMQQPSNVNIPQVPSMLGQQGPLQHSILPQPIRSPPVRVHPQRIVLEHASFPPNRPVNLVPLNSPGWPPSPQLGPHYQRPGNMVLTIPSPVSMPERASLVATSINPSAANVPYIHSRHPTANFGPPANFSRPSVAPSGFMLAPLNGSILAHDIAQSSAAVSMTATVAVSGPTPPQMLPPVSDPAAAPTANHIIRGSIQTQVLPPQTRGAVMTSTPAAQSPAPSLSPGLVTIRSTLPPTAPSPPLLASASTSLHNYSPAMSATPGQVTVPKPHPSSHNFTFQPLSVPSRQNSPVIQPLAHNSALPAPQAPSFRPALPNHQPPPVVCQSTHSAVNLTGPRAPVLPPVPSPPIPLPNNLVNPQPRSMIPILSNTPGPCPIVAMPPPNQMLRPTFMPASQVHNLPGPMPVLTVEPRQVMLSLPGRPAGPQMVYQQQAGGTNSFCGVMGKVALTPIENQVYDPFSPTSVSSLAGQQGEEHMKVKTETDAEYEDLMASVGVR